MFSTGKFILGNGLKKVHYKCHSCHNHVHHIWSNMSTNNANLNALVGYTNKHILVLSYQLELERKQMKSMYA